MKTLKVLLAAVTILSAFTYVSDAKAALIITATTEVNWAFDGNGNFTAADLQFFLNTNTAPAGFTLIDADPNGATYSLGGDTLSMAYKGNNSGTEEGVAAFISAYNTSFQNANEFATINYGSGAVIAYEHTFLIVKDGNAVPNVYVYDLNSLNWNGTDQIQIGDGITDLFGANGSISHVEIVVGGQTLEEDDPPGAPEPASLVIWGLGMVAAGIGARRMRKQK